MVRAALPGLLLFVASVLSGCASASSVAGDTAVSEPAPPPPLSHTHTGPEPGRVVTAADVMRGLPEGVRLFRGDGSPAEWSELVAAAGEVDVVLLGELHDDAVGHRTRHALVRERLEAGDDLAISLEMFEADVQGVVNEYLLGLITEDHFLAASRPWSNHDPDYRPYLEMARAHGVPVVAANPPRRYVNRVSRLGPGSLEELPDEAARWLPPLPYPAPSDAYRDEWNALMGGAGAHGGHGDPDPEAAERMLQSQALWDAGMAWAIARTLDEGFAAQVIHVAGAFHVAGGTGIPEVLEHYRPGTSMLLVVGQRLPEDGGFDPDTHGNRGDFVFLSPR